MDELLPGSGFCTAIVKVPDEVAFPCAFNCVAETNVVESGVPPKRTCAPETNLVPVTVRAKLPRLVDAGDIPVSVGVGFSSVTVAEPLTEASATLVARIVMVFGLGKEIGAVYLPLVSIVPTVGDPPVVPFTDHVTLVFCAPLTVAVKVYESPARTLALAGETETLAPEEDEFPFAFVEETPPEHPGRKARKKTVMISAAADLRQLFDM